MLTHSSVSVSSHKETACPCQYFTQLPPPPAIVLSLPPTSRVFSFSLTSEKFCAASPLEMIVDAYFKLLTCSSRFDIKQNMDRNMQIIFLVKAVSK